MTEAATRDRDTRATGTTQRSRLLRKVSFEGVVEAPDALDIDVDMVGKHPGLAATFSIPILAIAWRNTGTEPLVIGDKLRVVPLKSRNDEYDQDLGLTLFPRVREIERKSKYCPDYALGSTYSIKTVAGPINEVEPGETVIQSYEVWGDPNAEGCMAPGVYQFGYDETPWLIALRVTDLTD